MGEQLNRNDGDEPVQSEDQSTETQPTEVQLSVESESTDLGIVRLGRISAFGPSLDGGFGIND